MILIMVVLFLQGNPFIQYTTNPLYNYTGIGMIILAVCTHLTVIQRILHARKALGEIEEPSEMQAEETVVEENHTPSERLVSSARGMTPRTEKAIT